MLSKKKYVKKMYQRAPAFARIFARTFDILLIFGIWVSTYFIFQMNGFDNFNFFIATLINVSISLFYFIFFLYVFGRTPFMFLFKIKLFNDKENNNRLIIKIIQHEFFLTIFYDIFILILAFFLLGVGQSNSILFFRFLFPQVFIGSIMDGEIELVPLGIKVFAYFYSAFSFALSFIFITIIGLTIYKSKKRTWIDSISSTNTLWMGKDAKVVVNQSKIEIVVDMPGVFDINKIIIDEETKYD